jgi:hypothetical protein
MDGWGDFAVAAAGATGALAGLVIVAISVNVRQIAASKPLLAGAAGTIASLVHGVVASLLVLIPEQSHAALATELLASTVVAGAFYVRAIVIDVGAFRRREGMTGPVLGLVIALSVVQYAPFLVASGMLFADLASGIFALAAGVILLVAVSMLNAWLLLIEVVRGD